MCLLNDTSLHTCIKEQIIGNYDQKYHIFSYYFLISATSIANISKRQQIDLSLFANKLFTCISDNVLQKYNDMLSYYNCYTTCQQISTFPNSFPSIFPEEFLYGHTTVLM